MSQNELVNKEAKHMGLPLKYNFDKLFGTLKDQEPLIVQKKRTSPVEEAKALEKYLEETGKSQSALAKELHIHRSVITRTLRILKLSRKRQERIEELNLRGRVFRDAIYIEDEDEFNRFIDKELQKQLTVSKKKKKVSSVETQEAGNNDNPILSNDLKRFRCFLYRQKDKALSLLSDRGREALLIALEEWKKTE